jgi:hypothetical protein
MLAKTALFWLFNGGQGGINQMQLKRMRKFLRTILICAPCLAAFLLAGCTAPQFMSATTDQYKPFPDQTKTVEDPAKSRIYLMRKEKFFGAGEGFEFYSSSPDATGPRMDYSEKFRLIGKVGPASYICWEETPHPLTMQSRQGGTNSLETIDLQAGHVYYLQAYFRTGWKGPSPQIRVLSDEEGQEMLKGCQPPPAYRTHK